VSWMRLQVCNMILLRQEKTKNSTGHKNTHTPPHTRSWPGEDFFVVVIFVVGGTTGTQLSLLLGGEKIHTHTPTRPKYFFVIERDLKTKKTYLLISTIYSDSAY
jgi:hypothetical protein